MYLKMRIEGCELPEDWVQLRYLLRMAMKFRISHI